MAKPEEACIICQEPLDQIHQAMCQMCGGRFHQPWSVDAQVPQCGRITSDHDALALVFFCRNCYQTVQTGNG